MEHQPCDEVEASREAGEAPGGARGVSKPGGRLQLPAGAARVALVEGAQRSVAQQRGRRGERRLALRHLVRRHVSGESRGFHGLHGLQQALGSRLDLSLRPARNRGDGVFAIDASVLLGDLAERPRTGPGSTNTLALLPTRGLHPDSAAWSIAFV